MISLATDVQLCLALEPLHLSPVPTCCGPMSSDLFPQCSLVQRTKLEILTSTQLTARFVLGVSGAERSQSMMGLVVVCMWLSGCDELMLSVLD